MITGKNFYVFAHDGGLYYIGKRGILKCLKGNADVYNRQGMETIEKRIPEKEHGR